MSEKVVEHIRWFGRGERMDKGKAANDDLSRRG